MTDYSLLCAQVDSLGEGCRLPLPVLANAAALLWMTLPRINWAGFYLLRGGELRTLSVAHTDEQLLRQLGIERRPGLTQFLGIDEGDAPIEPHVVSFELAAGDRILLASDGLTDMVDEAVIAHAMQSAASVEALVRALRDQALANGGEDNVTIIACEVLA